MHNRFVRLCVATTALILWAVPSARGASIGINFATGRASTEVDSVTGPAGVVSQPNWNNISANTGAIPLFSDTATPTTAAISTFTATNSYSTFGATQTDQNLQLLNAYLDNTNAATPTTVTITGVPYATYDVIAYVGSDGNGRTGHATIGTTSFYYSTNSNQSPFPGYVQSTATTLAGATSANYVRFTGLTGSTFTLTNTRDANNTGLNGFQIVQTPEPASLGVVALSGLALLARRRRSA